MTPVEKPAGLTHLTLTVYNQHIEHVSITDALRPLLAQHDVTLDVREVSYESWHQGTGESDIWLGSVNFTLPLDYSLFALLYEVPLLQHCLPVNWQQDAARWREKTLPLLNGRNSWLKATGFIRCFITGCCWKASAVCAEYG